MLAGDLMKVAFWARDQNDNLVTVIETYLDDVLVPSTAVQEYYASYFVDVDFTGVQDGPHTITIKVRDAQNLEASTSIQIVVNEAELQRQALQFLQDTEKWYNPPVAIRWADSSLPLQVVVNTLFPQKRFDEIKTATAFWTRYTRIPIEIVWGTQQYYDMCGADRAASVALLERKIYIQPSDTCLFGYVGTAYQNYENYAVRWGVINMMSSSTVVDGGDLISIFTHELGHVIAPLSIVHTSNGSIMDVSFERKLPPDMERAWRILYLQLQPGDLIPLP